MVKESTHGHFMLLLRVTGVNEGKIDALAKQIHDEYMEEYGAVGAMTVMLLRLASVVGQGTNVQAPQWDYAIRYFGPTASVAWLQTRLESVAKEANLAVQTQTYPVSDITGRY